LYIKIYKRYIGISAEWICKPKSNRKYAVLEQAEKTDEDIWLIGQITDIIELTKLRVEKKVKKHISMLINA
jgi:hypothetical protein